MKPRQQKLAKKKTRNKQPSDKIQLPPLLRAAEQGDVKRIEELLNCGADLHQKSDFGLPLYHGADALILAARNAQLEAVNFLLRQGANIKATAAYGGALEEAVSRGHAEVARALLKAGARQFGFGLFCALDQRFVDVFRAVAEAGIRFEGFHERLTKRSLLEEAIHTKRFDMADFLLNEGFKPTGGGALCECAATGNAELARRLIQQGANPRQTNAKHYYPLCDACYWGN